MKFTSDVSIKNIKRKPFRAIALSALVMLIAFTVFSGAFVIISLQNGLEGYRARLPKRTRSVEDISVNLQS